MSTNDTIITTAKRVSENSALDSWLLIVCHSKSGVALKIMMVADNNIHFKINHKNKHVHVLSKTTIYWNKQNKHVYTVNLATRY